MKEPQNPFPLSGYYGPALFCDREEETRRLADNARNGINTTLLSIRRMGKTGLIHHAFHTLKKSKTDCIYVDIYATQNLKDFTNQLAAAILKVFPDKKGVGKKFIELLKSLRPVISFDALSGQPEVSFDFSQPRQYEHSLASLFSFLENRENRVIIAIDEFQQIGMYPEKNMEALLRTLIQPLKNVQFIFSGSNKHLLGDIFSNSKRPFFASTQAMYLAPIPAEKYLPFISGIFRGHKRKISEQALSFIAEWSRLHTYYTQAVCNRLYASGAKEITETLAREECGRLLKEQEGVFFQYRNLLSSVQWNLLKAIAREERVYQPSARRFIMKYQLGTPAHVQRAMEALMNKEMVYREKDEKGSYYSVYDCFLARWLEKHTT